MAPALTSDDTVKFLLACIKHTIAGRPDFQKVADETDVVSKGAAAKRYERLLKANDVALPSQRKATEASTTATTSTSPKPKAPRVTAKPSPSKKRKLKQRDDDDSDHSDADDGQKAGFMTKEDED